MTREVDLGALARELAADGEVMALESVGADRWAIHGLRPELVCAPSTAEGMASALARCDRAGAAAIPWGGGTQQRLGLPPRRADVVLHTGRLNRVVEYEPADLTATVEVGMRFADFQKLLGERGQWLPLDPPVRPEATLGGLVATNSSGPRRLKDGGLRDLVIGTRIANVDGTVTKAGGRVVKNVTGYDLNKAHVGALGTLGVLVEVAFKIAPRPESERTWIGTFAAAEDAGRAMVALSRLPLAPTALDLLNDRAVALAGLAVAPGRWVLLAHAGGFRQSVERHLAEFGAAGRAAGLVDAQVPPEDAADALWAAYGEMAAALRWSAGALTCRLAVPPASVAPLGARLADFGGEPAIWAHGTGALFWSVPAGSAGGEGGTIGVLRDLAGAAGGGLVVENRPEEMADVDVWGTPGGPMTIMRALKAQCDPNGTLNPGRFVGGI